MDAAVDADADALVSSAEWPEDEADETRARREKLAKEWVKFRVFKKVKVPLNDEEAVQQLRDAVHFNASTRRWSVRSGTSFVLFSKSWSTPRDVPFKRIDYVTGFDFNHAEYSELHSLTRESHGATSIGGTIIGIPDCSPHVGWCSSEGNVRCTMVPLNGWDSQRLVSEIHQIRIDAEREANGLAAAAAKKRVGVE